MLKENEENEKHIGLVLKISVELAKRFGMEKNEAISVGWMGYQKAVASYDASQSQFSTYAWKCIRNEIFKHIQKERKFKERFLVSDEIEKEQECTDEIFDEKEIEIVKDFIDKNQILVERFRNCDRIDSIAERHNIDKFTLYAKIQRDLKSLKKEIELWRVKQQKYPKNTFRISSMCDHSLIAHGLR